jgi:hypothetical protein
MRKKSIILLVIAILCALSIVAILTLTVPANLDKTPEVKQPKDENLIGTEGLVIVTGNFASSRLLAETIQESCGLPLILLNQDPETKKFKTVFLIQGTDQVKSFEIDKLKDLINSSKYKGALFIGNDKYLPEKYKNPLESNLKVYRLDDDDWLLNAEKAEKLLKTKGILQKFKSHYMLRQNPRQR